MSSRREVLVTTLALLQRNTSHVKMLKTALFDCAINEKCCSVDGGRGMCPLFWSPPRGIWQLKSPDPREFVIQGKKMLMPGDQPGGGKGWLGAAGIDWCITSYSHRLFFIRIQFKTLKMVCVISFFYKAFVQFSSRSIELILKQFLNYSAEENRSLLHFSFLGFLISSS